MKSDLDEIEAKEDELQAAMLSDDLAALDALLDEDLMFTGPDGTVASKADDLGARKAGVVKMSRINRLDRKVKVWGDTASVAVTVDLTGSFRGQPFQGRYAYTRLWRRRQGAWKVLAGQVAAVPGA